MGSDRRRRNVAEQTFEPLIDANEAGRILKLHPVTIREMAGQGRLPGLKIGKVWRFRVSSLDAWIDSQLQCVHYPQSPESEKR
jgi:excisionase family DNA binding protein